MMSRYQRFFPSQCESVRDADASISFNEADGLAFVLTLAGRSPTLLKELRKRMPKECGSTAPGRKIGNIAASSFCRQRQLRKAGSDEHLQTWRGVLVRI